MGFSCPSGNMSHESSKTAVEGGSGAGGVSATAWASPPGHVNPAGHGTPANPCGQIGHSLLHRAFCCTHVQPPWVPRSVKLWFMSRSSLMTHHLVDLARWGNRILAWRGMEASPWHRRLDMYTIGGKECLARKHGACHLTHDNDAR